MKRYLSIITLSLFGTAAYAVPVVPNFQQGSMTSHTETESTITETINSIDYSTGWEYSVTGVGIKNNGAALNPNVNTSTVTCLLYTSPSPRDLSTSRMPSSA